MCLSVCAYKLRKGSELHAWVGARDKDTAKKYREMRKNQRKQGSQSHENISLPVILENLGGTCSYYRPD